jgi:hypothetical protein
MWPSHIQRVIDRTNTQRKVDKPGGVEMYGCLV